MHCCWETGFEIIIKRALMGGYRYNHNVNMSYEQIIRIRLKNINRCQHLSKRVSECTHESFDDCAMLT